MKQIKAIKDSLTQNQFVDIICTINNTENLKAVLPVYLDYFFNNNMNELIDGNFTVVGKVIKIVNDHESNINLFRNTGFKLFQQDVLEGMFESFKSGMGNQIDIPEISTKIGTPSILVLPISIYA